jgi:hypothetical protein
MHINKDEIKIVKLVNGEDVICKITKGKSQLPDNAPLIRLEKPLLIKYVPQISPYGIKDYVALTKWTAYTPDKIITIPKDKIMTITNASDEMTASYWKLASAYDNAPAEIPPSIKMKEDIERMTEEDNEEFNELFDEHNDKRTIH